jgi:YfiR/HmsC-like
VETVNLQYAVEGLRSKRRAAAACRSLAFGPRFYSALLLALFTVLSSVYLEAQQARPTEAQVKAAYLFNFGKFVRWRTPPENRADSLEICVLGRNSFGAVLDATVKGESIDGKPVIARSVSSLHEAEGCRILFVSLSEESRLSTVLAEAKRLPVLTVSDIPHFAERGGMIGLVNQDDRIRFEVNIVPMEDVGLTVSSELLKVALRVIRKSGGGA